MKNTIEEVKLPALSPSEHGQLNEAFGIPDVSAIIVETTDPENLVEFVYALESQRLAATRKFAALCESIDDAIIAARGRIKAAITESGGTALPHDTFDVRIEQTTQRDKRIDVLRALEGVLPADLYREAVRVKRISGTLDPQVVELAVATGASVEWDADLRKLDVHARKFGGKIAEIVAEGSPRVEIGAPKLIIEPRPSALKSVSE